jgi:hypothetical protein
MPDGADLTSGPGHRHEAEGAGLTKIFPEAEFMDDRRLISPVSPALFRKDVYEYYFMARRMGGGELSSRGCGAGCSHVNAPISQHGYGARPGCGGSMAWPVPGCLCRGGCLLGH